MNRPRLTSTTMNPALRNVLAKLYIDTRIDPLMFADWIRANIIWLRAYYQESGGPVDEHEAYAWLRLQFIHRGVAA